MENHLIRYSSAAVAYLDLLRFSEWIDDTRDHPALLQAIVASFEEMYNWLSGFKPAQYTAFSDSVVVFAEGSFREAFSEVARTVMMIQARMPESHALFRGGIAYGEFCHRERFIIGPALVEAHDVEVEMADWPRVVVHPDTVRRIADSPPAPGDTTFDLVEPLRCTFIGNNSLLYLDYLSYNFDLIALGAIMTAGKYDDNLEPAHRTFLAARQTLEHEVSRLAAGTKPGILERRRQLQRWICFAQYLNRAVSRILSELPPSYTWLTDASSDEQPLYMQWARLLQSQWQRGGVPATETQAAFQDWWRMMQEERQKVQHCMVDIPALSLLWRVVPPPQGGCGQST